MKGRKWEDLDVDCLVNVLRRVGLKSLLFDVPFVCKSWHEASIHPSCWEHPVSVEAGLDGGWNFSTIEDRFRGVYGINNFSMDAFIKFIVDRSHGKCTVLDMSHCSKETLKYASDNCPALRMLWLSCSPEESFFIPEVIGKWKHLEGLVLVSSSNLVEIVSKISLECKNFVGLCIRMACIEKEEALAILTYLPRIKYLFLPAAVTDRENLISILQGCKELVHLDVVNSMDLEADDKILELASHIPMFIHRDGYWDLRPASLEDIDFDKDFFLGDSTRTEDWACLWSN